jgi:DnaJ-class molecular chaperone
LGAPASKQTPTEVGMEPRILEAEAVLAAAWLSLEKMARLASQARRASPMSALGKMEKKIGARLRELRDSEVARINQLRAAQRAADNERRVAETARTEATAALAREREIESQQREMRRQLRHCIVSNHLARCPSCAGTLRVEITCPDCSGSGASEVPWRLSEARAYPCISCGGTGYSAHESCPQCGGTGSIVRQSPSPRWSTHCRGCSASGLQRVACSVCDGRGYIGSERVLDQLAASDVADAMARELLLIQGASAA